ncbi:MAG: AraC family transcriptional regulator [Cytophagales bacterium]|nr:MAG: AraC family transcriptional regulator [Cytophagales bacterium]
MEFYFSAYSSPLLFGFVQAWIYALLLWVRGRREERLSDVLLGWVLVGMAFNIWEYMLGFGGINLLWNQLEFFPRTLGYLFPVLCYFYLKSQVNADFRIHRRDLWHAVPFLIYCTYHITVFAMGPAFVHNWKIKVVGPYHLETVEFVIGLVIDVYYLILALRLYRQYRAWIKTQFSETETISLRWFRNLLIGLTAMSLFSLIMTVVSQALGLDYWQNWWDELAQVALIYYVSINGYAQAQPGRRLNFGTNDAVMPPFASLTSVAVAEPISSEQLAVGEAAGVRATVAPVMPDELLDLRDKLITCMTTDKPYLDPDLSLADLARRMHTNPVVLSQVINTGVGKNFNDFVNEYRVEEFKQQVRNPDNAHLSFLGLALDCGFNSKATFNRAFKKFTGQSPKEFAQA